MSTNRYNELRVKYQSIRQDTFDKLFDADETPTKKYIAYFFKMWGENKQKHSMAYVKMDQLINSVKRFDALLPYIADKDIYSNFYNNYNNLEKTIEDAQERKTEKFKFCYAR